MQQDATSFVLSVWGSLSKIEQGTWCQPPQWQGQQVRNHADADCQKTPRPVTLQVCTKHANSIKWNPINSIHNGRCLQKKGFLSDQKNLSSKRHSACQSRSQQFAVTNLWQAAWPGVSMMRSPGTCTRRCWACPYRFAHLKHLTYAAPK